MILVTGATGFVGRHLMARLRARGAVIRPLARSPREAEWLRGDGIEPAVGDVTDPASLTRAMEGVDTAIHLAAVFVERGAATFERVNAQGARNVAATARAAGVTRLLHLSVDGARYDRRYPYLRSKWRGEQAVIESGIPYAVLRPSLIFGAGDQFFTTLATLARVAPVVPIVGDGKSLFQPVWVEDVCSCLLKILDDSAYLGRCYDIGGPERLSYDEMADIVMRVLGTRKRKVHTPTALAKRLVALTPALPAASLGPEQLSLLDTGDSATLNPLSALFGIERPAYLQAKLGYIGR